MKFSEHSSGSSGCPAGRISFLEEARAWSPWPRSCGRSKRRIAGMIIFNGRAALMALIAAAFAFGAVKPVLGVLAGNLAFGVLLVGLDLTYRLHLGGDEDESAM